MSVWRRRLAAGPLLLLLAAPAAADREEDLQQLRDAIGERRERVERYEREERGLLDALEAIEITALLLERDVERASREVTDARDVLAHAEADAVDVAARLARTERAMAKRAAGLYRTGQLGALPMLFDAGGLQDFLSRVQTLRRLLNHDVTLLERHRAESRALVESRARAERAAQASQAAREAFASRSAQLEEERGQKRRIVTRLRSSRAHERVALAELETAARALEETVASLSGQGGGVLASGDPRFASLRGRLPRPVAAGIARGFGRVVDSEFQTEIFRKGVDFDAPMGSAVRAVAAGRVRHAGRFRGYGNVVILDHGADYFSVSAHLSAIEVEVGQRVGAGAPIGRVGDSGSLVGAHLYFEIRRGAEPLDPGRWLRSGAG